MGNITVTNPTIASLVEEIRSGKINLSPIFQRKFVWTLDYQEEFIDTILKGYPFPEVYMYQSGIDIQTARTYQSVVDGQQRLTTILNYIDGIAGRKYKKILAYAELTNEQKENFLSYPVVVRNLGKTDEEEIREIFRRINLTGFNLEGVEIHNAVYSGQFIMLAKKILENIDLEYFPIFYESEITRMADLFFVLLVMSTLENGGYFARDSEMEKYLMRYNEEYRGAENMFTNLVNTFEILKKLGLKEDSIWFRKSNIFTLVVEIVRNINLIEISSFGDKLSKFEGNVLENKNNRQNDYGEYYYYMYSGTASRQARVKRGEIFLRHVLAK